MLVCGPAAEDTDLLNDTAASFDLRFTIATALAAPVSASHTTIGGTAAESA
jgi:hypothetical protein